MMCNSFEEVRRRLETGPGNNNEFEEFHVACHKIYIEKNGDGDVQ
jgi:hypothetical protein